MTDLRPVSPHLAQNWVVTKPVASGRHGVVVSQVRAAADAGVAALEAGGNAVDAAVATAFAVFAAEPWNAGLGGVGFALVQAAGEPRASIVDFGPVAPARLDPEAFKLTGRHGADLFGWPEVERDVNIHGPLSFCVPSAVAGLHAMHERWGRLPVRDLLAPAVALAKRGLPYDWYAALKVLQSASLLKLYPEAGRLYVPNGAPRSNAHPMTYLPLGKLSATMERLRDAGLADFYSGELGGSIASDAASRGAVLTRDDLRGYRVGIGPAGEAAWRGSTVQIGNRQTAAPALFRTLARMGCATRTVLPTPGWYVTLARTLGTQQAARIGSDGSTTHLSVVDGEGGAVSLTTTLLSVFGSGVVLPESGVLMNNGVMWFDPMRGRPNSIRGGGRPMTNMCPVLVRDGGLSAEGGGGAPSLVAGASGGRRILPAVAQVLLYATEFGMGAGAAAATPRIDTSMPPRVVADHRLPPDVLAALAADLPVETVEPTLSPGLFGAAGLVARDEDGGWSGASDPTPWSAAIAATI